MEKDGSGLCMKSGRKSSKQMLHMKNGIKE